MSRLKQPAHPRESKRNKPALPPAARKFQSLLHKANDAYDVATIYIEDGALLSGAKHLRAAANLLQQAHETRERAL